MDPPRWAAVWNLLQETEEPGLRTELDFIDLVPETFVKVTGMDGAFLLQYRDHPRLAGAISMALNDTRGYLKDNGEYVRVVQCDQGGEAPADIPTEIWSAFEQLHSTEKLLSGDIEPQG